MSILGHPEAMSSGLGSLFLLTSSTEYPCARAAENAVNLHFQACIFKKMNGLSGSL